MAEGSGDRTSDDGAIVDVVDPTVPTLPHAPVGPTLRSVVDDLVTGTGPLDPVGLQHTLESLRTALDLDLVGLRPAGRGHAALAGRMEVGDDELTDVTVEAPVTVDGALVAVLSAAARDVPEPLLEAATLAVPTAIGAACERTDHRRLIGELQTTDPLTELPNRRAFIEQLQRLFPTATAERPVVVAMLDVNGMLTYNDTHGHAAGDRLLVAVGELLREVSGELPGTLVARLGGDEFGLITAEHEVDDVVAGLTRVQARAGSDLGISIGCGVAEHHGDTSLGLPTDLLRLADVAQFRAKRTREAAPVVAGSADRDLARTVAEQETESDAALAPVTALRPKRRWLRDGRHQEP